jgi:hypothetical protein
MLTAMRYILLSPVAQAAGQYAPSAKSDLIAEDWGSEIGGCAAFVNNEKGQQK